MAVVIGCDAEQAALRRLPGGNWRKLIALGRQRMQAARDSLTRLRRLGLEGYGCWRTREPVIARAQT
jgi:hypothetical protein